MLQCSLLLTQKFHATTSVEPAFGGSGSRDAYACLKQEARLPLRTHLRICMLLRMVRFWYSNSFPEEQCTVYRSPSNTMASWRSGGLPPEKFSLSKLSTMLKNAPSENRRDRKSSVKRAILTSPAPMDEGRGGSCHSCFQRKRPWVESYRWKGLLHIVIDMVYLLFAQK